MKCTLFILWISWSILAVSLCQLIGHTNEELKAYLWCGAGLLIGIIYALLISIKVKPTNEPTVIKYGVLVLVVIVHFFFWFANPIKEDDYFRYSFDGRNSRLGEHPYLNPPEYYISTNTPEYVKNINHPNLLTIYSPVAQVLFLSESFYPNTIYGWWLLILVADIFLVMFTWRFMIRRKINGHYFAMIWLNPIWLKEGLNSGHLDIMVSIFLWLAVYFSVKNAINKNYMSSFLISISIGIRPYLGILMIDKLYKREYRQFLFCIFILVLPWVVIFLLPHAPPINDALKSWKIFMVRWEFNSLFYDFFYRLNKIYCSEWKWARYVGWFFGCISMIVVYWKSRLQSDKLFWGSMGVTTWLLFQPTVNAWYFLPMIAVSSAYLLFNNINESLYKGFLAATAIALPMAYMHYLDLDRSFLDFKWALGEILILVLTFLFFALQKKDQTLNT